jgi:hypothetical protein
MQHVHLALRSYKIFLLVKNFLRYHSCHSPDTMQTVREATLNHTTRPLVASAVAGGGMGASSGGRDVG